MQFLFVFLCFSFTGIVFGVDSLAVLLDYAKTVRGFNSMTVFLCTMGFVPRSWISRNSNSMFMQMVDMDSSWNWKKIRAENNCHQLLVLDLSCPRYSSAFKILSQNGQFNNLCRAWLLLDSSSNSSWFSEDLKPILDQTEFTYLANVVYWTTSPIDYRSDEVQNQDNIFIYDLW